MHVAPVSRAARCALRRRVAAAACAVGLMAGPSALAYDGFSSEAAHVVGSAVLAGAVTALASDHWPEQRALIGFGVSAGLSLLGELVPLAAGKTTRVHSALLDIGCELFGAALGAVVTDQYLLKPVVAVSPSGQVTIGAVFKASF
jgi:hypothetical protein